MGRPNNHQGDHKKETEEESGIATQERTRVKQPPMYKVLLLNDDYTPMDFVVLVLQKFFNKDPGEATQIMLSVHTKGVGVCGIYAAEIAETKVAAVSDFARKNAHPLLCTMEPL